VRLHRDAGRRDPAVSLPVDQVDLGPGVRAGFTSRAGGVSVGPWSGLDLGLHVGDDPDLVRRNRALLEEWVGAPVRFPRQVHGTQVLLLDQEQPVDEPPADAVVSAAGGPAAGVLVADCVPVLLADADAGVVAAAHAGWRGLLAGILPATVSAMVARGAAPERIRAALGPAALACCYEVGEQLRRDAAERLPATWATTRAGAPALDLRAGCRSVLEAAGVSRVEPAGGCTIEDDRWYSYRRQHVTGRFAGVVRMLG
jgi:YfiH family protein